MSRGLSGEVLYRRWAADPALALRRRPRITFHALYKPPRPVAEGPRVHRCSRRRTAVGLNDGPRAFLPDASASCRATLFRKQQCLWRRPPPTASGSFVLVPPESRPPAFDQTQPRATIPKVADRLVVFATERRKALGKQAARTQTAGSAGQRGLCAQPAFDEWCALEGTKCDHPEIASLARVMLPALLAAATPRPFRTAGGSPKTAALP